MIKLTFQGDSFPRIAVLTTDDADAEMGQALDALEEMEEGDSPLAKAFKEVKQNERGDYVIEYAPGPTGFGLLIDLAMAAEWYDVEQALDDEREAHLAHLAGGDAPTSDE